MNNKKLILYSDILLYLCIFILSLILGFEILHVNFSGDDWKILTANESLESGTLKYWIYIFTSPIHGGTQYRPISIFAYPFLIKKFFGANIFVFNLVAFSTFCSIVLLLTHWLKLTFKNNLSILIGILIFLLNPIPFDIANAVSHQFKYYTPCLCLLISLIIIEKNELSKRNILLLILLQIISIMSHEGSLTFFCILWCFHFFKNKEINKKIIFLIIPSAFYLIARVFIFKFKKQGFMSIDISEMPANILFFLKALLSDLFFLNNLNLNLILTAVLVVIAHVCGDSKKIIKMYLPLLTMIIVLSPFSIIFRHLIENRSFWAIIFLSYFIVHILSVLKDKNKNLYYGICIILLVILAPVFFTKVDDFRTRFADTIFINSDRKHPRIEELIKSVQHEINKYPNKNEFRMNISSISNPWVVDSIIPGILATYFKNKMFYVFNMDNNQGNVKTITYNGSYYNSWDLTLIAGGEDLIDPYGYIQNIDYLGSEEIVELDIDFSIFNEFYPLGPDDIYD